jgi:hypothetical protein
MRHDPILLLRDALRSGDDPLVAVLLRTLRRDPALRERADGELARLPRLSPTPLGDRARLEPMLMRLRGHGDSARSVACRRDNRAVFDALTEAVFAVSPAVRYVALARGQDVKLRERPGMSDASSSESDRYEELLVNPTLLELARRRGEIDCGGLDYLVVAYGAFFQLVMPLEEGHVSVAVERSQTPAELVQPIREVLRSHGIEPAVV